MRKTSVVTKAAKEPTPRVMRDGNLDVPFDPCQRIKTDISRVRKARPAASGWSTRTPVVVRDIRSRSPSAFKASATVLSIV